MLYGEAIWIGDKLLNLSKNGDKILIDAQLQKIDLKISKSEIKSRFKKLKNFSKKYKKGILAKYASLVSSASKGAVTDVFDQ